MFRYGIDFTNSLGVVKIKNRSMFFFAWTKNPSLKFCLKSSLNRIMPKAPYNLNRVDKIPFRLIKNNKSDQENSY